jgi:tRNA threonylcarbamoyladenosine biosynthesis protein TsaB
MRILGFDTATPATTVALLDLREGVEVQAREARDDPAPRERPRHVTRLLPLITEALEGSGTGWEAIDLIAVGLGPGTFTGLRIGIATARALGQARSIPLAGVSTLESLATGAAPSADPGGAVLAVLDARRGEVFAAGWRTRGAPAEPLCEPQALAPEGLAEVVAELGPACLAIGSGAVEFRLQLERTGAVVPGDDSELHRVSAIHHCRLAARTSQAAGPDEIRPEYLRLPDAEIALRRRAAQDPT